MWAAPLRFGVSGPFFVKEMLKFEKHLHGKPKGLTFTLSNNHRGINHPAKH